MTQESERALKEFTHSHTKLLTDLKSLNKVLEAQINEIQQTITVLSEEGKQTQSVRSGLVPPTPRRGTVNM